MNPANNHENWVPLKPSDSDENIVPAHTIDCPFYSVVPTSSSQNELIEITNNDQSPSVSDEEITIEPETELDQPLPRIDNSLNAADLLDSELSKVSTLDELNPQEPSTSSQIPSTSPSTSTDSQESEIADPQQAAIDSEFNQLLQLNQELRTANDDFYAQIEGLTEALRDSQTELQRQKKRADVTESMLTQQNQELIAAQSQIESLVQQLEKSQQNVQREEALLETYRAHLDTCQQKLAQLERECANIKSSYNEQSQQLVQSETACRELRTRLMRQQRQTLQFKAALEKCLESPLPGGDTNNGSERISDCNATPSHHYDKTRALLNNTQPIKPWSSELDEVQHLPFKPYTQVSPWEPTAANPDEGKTSDGTSQVEETQSSSIPEETDLQSEEIENKYQQNTNTPTESTNPTNSPPTSASTVEQQIESLINQSPSNQSLESLEAQIDSVIQMFFTSSTAEKPSNLTADKEPTPTKSPEESNSQSDMEFDILSPWDTPSPTDKTNAIDTITVDMDGNITDGIDSNQPQENKPSPEPEQSQKPEPEDVWREMADLTPEEITLLNSPAISDIDDDKSPSPVVYPHRPPKGRKSFSSVELPNFPSPKKT